MARRSPCVPRPIGDRYFSISASNLVICDFNICAASLLDAFEYWHSCKKESASPRHDCRPTPDHVYQSYEDLRDALFHLYGRTMIIQAIKFLEEKGFLSSEFGPGAGRDRILYYLFNEDAVRSAVSELNPDFMQSQYAEQFFHRSNLNGAPSKSERCDRTDLNDEYNKEAYQTADQTENKQTSSSPTPLKEEDKDPSSPTAEEKRFSSSSSSGSLSTQRDHLDTDDTCEGRPPPPPRRESDDPTEVQTSDCRINQYQLVQMLESAKVAMSKKERRALQDHDGEWLESDIRFAIESVGVRKTLGRILQELGVTLQKPRNARAGDAGESAGGRVTPRYPSTRQSASKRESEAPDERKPWDDWNAQVPSKAKAGRVGRISDEYYAALPQVMAKAKDLIDADPSKADWITFGWSLCTKDGYAEPNWKRMLNGEFDAVYSRKPPKREAGGQDQWKNEFLNNR